LDEYAFQGTRVREIDAVCDRDGVILGSGYPDLNKYQGRRYIHFRIVERFDRNFRSTLDVEGEVPPVVRESVGRMNR
jgi:hypothetical protein